MSTVSRRSSADRTAGRTARPTPLRPPVTGWPEWGPPAPADSAAAVLDDLCGPLFASLRRSDQRRRGAEYVQGLLSTGGRKSIRNMAALIGGSGTGQRLHHFICSSTWDWTPVRRALARYLTEAAPPQAWVVRPMTIPKVGQHSVGVSRYFSPDEGQTLNAQRAVGVWAVSEELSAPVNWRLHLPQTWIKDGLRRNQASIPCEVEPETIGDCAVTACQEMFEGWDLPPRPVVVDVGEADPLATIAGLRARGIPSLVRVADGLSLTLTDPGLTGHGTRPMTAAGIMRAARNMGRPVTWRPGATATTRTALVTTVRVGVRGAGQDGGPLLLVGLGPADRSRAPELWLTDLPAGRSAAFPQWADGVRRVDRAFDDITAQVGIRDYVGRSYSGWHRHVTLASAAHTVAVLSTPVGVRPVRAS
ncbi:IS701 family transposase [Streptomyces cavourensis]|uniref:Transposase n=1 Tax=Streptomyces cavourensis TaxID=67258 RepID=A0ABY5F409_9ACTN|nr:transposase [Streptomyces cavourensis]UTR78436.1 transposase [Streptomyces cavourensis]